MRRTLVSLTVSMSCSFFGLLAAPASPQAPPPVGDLSFLPGDLEVGLAPEVQNQPAIAAGGPGYLVVWRDLRTAMCPFTNTSDPLCGNSDDIYAARLDAEGNLLDASPILVTQEGHNQWAPQVAWNGEMWLVVWMRQRDEWYFFEDVVAARVSAAGVVLDPEPIPIDPDCTNGCWSGYAPEVGSDGENWLVVWEDLVDVVGIPYPTLDGMRVAPDGSLLDPAPVILQQHTVPAFGPRTPQVEWAGDEYLVLWTEAAPAEVRFRRYTADLQPLDAAPRHVSNDDGAANLATDGDRFMATTPFRRAYRIDHAGTVLDPAGIGFDAGGGWQPTGPDVAWDGFDWIVTFASTPAGQTDPDVYLVRISAGGAVLEGPTPVVGSGTEDDYEPAIASAGGGAFQLAWAPRASGSPYVPDNIRAANLFDFSQPAVETPTGVGLARQAWVDFASNGGEHLATFLAQGRGLTRLLAQRLAADGTPLDAEPVLLATFDETIDLAPRAAFDGERYLVVWALGSTVWGRRLAADGTPIDPAPVALLTDADFVTAAAAGGLDGTFLVTYLRLFSGDQQEIKAARFAGADLAQLDTPFRLEGDFSSKPRVVGFAGQWLAVWQWNVSHDSPIDSTHGALVSSDGVSGGAFGVGQTGEAATPDVAAAADRALVVWSDDTGNNSALEGRLLGADGSFLGGEFTIADEPNYQLFPTAAWDGAQFVAAWSDYRSLPGIEQLRADIWAMRIDPEGNLLDAPGGFQLTEGPLPEDLPAAAAFDGRTVVAFSRLAGLATPEVQRIGYRVVGIEGVMIFEDGFESGDTSAWSVVLGN